MLITLKRLCLQGEAYVQCPKLGKVNQLQKKVYLPVLTRC